MSNDRTDILICRDCGIAIARQLEGLFNPSLRMGDIVLLGRCPSCKEE